MPDYRRLKEYSNSRLNDYSAGWQWKELSSSFVPSWVNWFYPLAVVGLVVGIAVAFVQDDRPVRSAGNGSSAAEEAPEENITVRDASGGSAVSLPAEAVGVIRAGVRAVFTGEAASVPLADGAVIAAPARTFPAAVIVSEVLVSSAPSTVVLSVTVAPGGQEGREPLRTVAGRAERTDGTWRFVP